MDKKDKFKNFALVKKNLRLIGIGIVIIIIGFILMVGSPTGETIYNPDIFSFRRTALSSSICFFGFLFIIFGILRKDKHE